MIIVLRHQDIRDLEFKDLTRSQCDFITSILSKKNITWFEYSSLSRRPKLVLLLKKTTEIENVRFPETVRDTVQFIKESQRAFFLQQVEKKNTFNTPSRISCEHRRNCFQTLRSKRTQFTR